VVFRSEEDAKKAVASNGMVFGGHHLRIDFANNSTFDAKKRCVCVGVQICAISYLTVVVFLSDPVPLLKSLTTTHTTAFFWVIFPFKQLRSRFEPISQLASGKMQVALP